MSLTSAILARQAAETFAERRPHDVDAAIAAAPGDHGDTQIGIPQQVLDVAQAHDGQGLADGLPPLVTVGTREVLAADPQLGGPARLPV